MYRDNPASPPNVATAIGSTRWPRKSHCCFQKDRYSQLGDRRPEMGSQPSCTPKNIIKSSANQKSGVAKPTNTKMVVNLSKAEYCRVALATPIGIATATMIRSSMTFNKNV